ncbi:MAG: rhomboid family intramembrane serine protease [Thermomicrobiales bacterium]
MIPIGDEPHGRRLTPVVTYTLLALNVIVFVYEMTLSERGLFQFFAEWAVVPASVSEGNDLVTLVTSQFMHGGYAHIIGNMLFLWVFGDNIEDIMGHAKFVIFYLLTGVVAALAQVLIDPGSTVPIVGASGAISGVLGAYIVLFPFGKIRTAILIGFIPIIFMTPAWLQIGLWALIQFFNGFAAFTVDSQEVGGVAYFAHIGGFLCGALAIWLFRDRESHERQRAARSGRGRPAFERVPRRAG